ncbi:hypothetical protein K1719_046591 [Acacia pycnantha]|nr:hypothetical protein K1719_046591 [Acacia pycnantha]
MPRYDDKYGNTRLYVGRLSSRTRSRDLDKVFGRYGRIRGVDMKHDYAFVEFSDPRDADDARYNLDGRDVDGSRIIVEFAKGGPRGSREYLGRGPPPGSGRCFNCEVIWNETARIVPRKSVVVDEVILDHLLGHVLLVVTEAGIEVTAGIAATADQDPLSEENVALLGKIDQSNQQRERGDISPENGGLANRQDGSDYSDGPRRSRSRSPVSPKTNGRGHSASPRDDRSPIDDDDVTRHSPRGSESP